MQSNYVLDTRGKVCPFPLVEAKEFVKEIPSGAEFEIYFDCTQATESIPLWAAQSGHEVKDFESIGAAEWKMILIKA